MSNLQGMTLVELMVTVVLISVLAILTWPMFSQMGHSYQLDRDINSARKVIEMTMNECLTRAQRGQVTISEPGTITGQVWDASTGGWEQVATSQLVRATYGRTNVVATPWLKVVTKEPVGLPTGATPLTVTFSALGVPQNPGFAVFLNYSRYDAVIEALPSGLIKVYTQDEGGTQWAR